MSPEKAISIIKKHAVDGASAAAKELDTINISDIADYKFRCAKTRAITIEDEGCELELEFRVIVICRQIR